MSTRTILSLTLPFSICLLCCPTMAEQTVENDSAVEDKNNHVQIHVGKTLDENSESVLNSYRAGNALMMEGKYEEAIVELNKVLALDPKFYDANRGLGICYAHLGKDKDAVKHYETYVNMRPHAADADKVRETIAKYKKSGD